MTEHDNNKSLQDAMDAPTPMDALTPVDEPTPVDGPLSTDGSDNATVEDQQIWTFKLNGQQYLNGKLIRKGEKGHADIYLVESEQMLGKKVMLKLYNKNIKPKDINAIDRISRITTLDQEVIQLVPILEYGWYKDADSEQDRFYELQAYMEGGSLDGLPNNTSAETLFTIIKSLCKALYQLNFACGIRHGDFKVSNLFLTSKDDGRVLIGDFDNAACKGVGTKDKAAFTDDYIKMGEMLKRFNVMKNNQSFADLQLILETSGCSWRDVAEWVGEYEHHNAQEGIEDISYLPLEVISCIAEQEALNYGCLGQKDFCTSVFSELLENSGFSQQADWAQHCLVDQIQNHNGCAPYSKYTAVWKFVAGLKPQDQPPVFKIEDVVIVNPDELKSKKVDKFLILDALDNGYLKDWLAIFFHEDPWKSFKKKYDYEHAIEDYLKFVKQLNPTDENVKRLSEARGEISKASSGVKIWQLVIRIAQVVGCLLFFIPSLLFLWWIISLGMPFDGRPASHAFGAGLIFIGCMVAGLIYYTFSFGYRRTGCGCLILGAAGAIIASVLYFVIMLNIDKWLPYLPWLFVFVILFAGVLMFWRIIFAKNLRASGGLFVTDPIDNPDIWTVQPLYYAFDLSSNGYNFRQGNTLQSLPSQYRAALKLMMQQILIPIVMAWGMWLGYKSITPELGGTKLTTIEDQRAELAGEWKGTFDDKEAVMQVVNTNPDSLQVSMTVTFKKPLTQTFTGKFVDPKVLLENETPDDGVLDGRIAGTLEGDGLDSFVGVYENYKNGKTYHIVLKKQIAENDSVQ